MANKLPPGWFYPADIREYRRIYGDLVPENGCTVEIGVYRGRSIAAVADLIIQKNITVGAVDLFEPYENDPATDRLECFTRTLVAYGLLDRVHILKGESTILAEHYSDASLDFVFIDADHSYNSVLADMIAWCPKVKSGGYLGGHDFREPGVYQAVVEAHFPRLATYTAQSSIWLTRIGASFCSDSANL